MLYVFVSWKLGVGAVRNVITNKIGNTNDIICSND